MIKRTRNIDFANPYEGFSAKKVEQLIGKGVSPTLAFAMLENDFAGLLHKYDDQLIVGFAARPRDSRLGCVIHGEIYFDFFDNPLFRRLGSIRQLGFVASNPLFIGATDTRLVHSMLTAAIVEYVLANNRLDEWINLGVASALLHDIAVPPYSDQGKLGNKELLDEERNIELLLKDRELEALLTKHGVAKEELLACVRGEHTVLGKLINSKDMLDADRMAHIARDCAMTYGKVPDEVLQVTGKKVKYILDVYEDVTIDSGVPVFSNPDRLAGFLVLRAIMHRDIYFHPLNRAREAFLRREMNKLWNAGVLTLEKMLAMSDWEFDRLMKEHLTPEWYSEFFSMTSSKFGEVRRFYDKTVGQVREMYGGQDVIVDEPRTFNPAINTLVMVNGKQVGFRHAKPEIATKLQEIVRSCEYVGVYNYGGEQITAWWDHMRGHNI